MYEKESQEKFDKAYVRINYTCKRRREENGLRTDESTHIYVYKKMVLQQSFAQHSYERNRSDIS